MDTISYSTSENAFMCDLYELLRLLWLTFVPPEQDFAGSNSSSYDVYPAQ